MAGKNVLLAGETWVSYGIHMKGFSAYTTGQYSEGMHAFVSAIEAGGDKVVHIPNHLATTEFPDSIDKLRRFDVAILSDLPADTLLLHPDTFERGLRTPDRLALLVDWIGEGGGFLMVGGYMSFSGFEGKARYQNTALAVALPVEMPGFDDRIELPSGANPRVVAPHPIVDGLGEQWPYVLGYNRFTAKPGADVIVECAGDPLLVVGGHGAGRVAAYATDCSPHWASPEFMAWPGYPRLWTQMIGWLAGMGA